MDKNRQIEEMAKEICSEYDCVIPCQSCAYYGYANCRDVKSAEKLYIAGYRKASDVAREIFEEIEEYMTPLEKWFLEMKRQNQDCSEEYWNGKFSAFKQLRGFIDVNIKKKYTEGEG